MFGFLSYWPLVFIIASFSLFMIMLDARFDKDINIHIFITNLMEIPINTIDDNNINYYNN